MAVAATLLLAALAGSARAAPPVAVDLSKTQAPLSKLPPVMRPGTPMPPPAKSPPANPNPDHVQNIHIGTNRAGDSCSAIWGEKQVGMAWISWPSVPGVANWLIYKGPPGGPYTLLHAMPPTTQIDILTPGLPGTTEAFVMNCKMGWVYSGYSNEIIVTWK
jgi:hypothetical protein